MIPPNLLAGRPVPSGMSTTVTEIDSPPLMDAHTLGLLEFDKVRELLAGYAASSLGRDLCRAVEPSTNAEQIRSELAFVSEMVAALDQNQPPPLSGLHDIRLLVKRAAIGTMLS